MTQERGKLEPCPFCGGEAIRQDLTDDDNAGGSCIACDQCGASSPVHFDRKENLYDSWNRRSTSSRREVLEEAARVRELALRLVQALNVHSVGAGLNGQAYTDVVGAKNLLARALAEEK